MKLRLKPQHAALIALAIFVIGIAVTSLLGLYSTKTLKIPAVLTSADYAGQYDPGDIRGSYTFADISSLYGVPLEDLAAAFGQDVRSASVLKCKDLGTLYAGAPAEIGTASMRLFVAYYTGLPYEPSGDTYLPETAAVILLENGGLNDARRSYLAAHTINII
jgi:hypothetical protein